MAGIQGLGLPLSLPLSLSLLLVFARLRRQSPGYVGFRVDVCELARIPVGFWASAAPLVR